MKKRIFLLVLLFSSMMLFAQETEKKDGTDMDIYTISVGFDLKYLKVNDSEYFNFYSDVSATILEVLPIDDNTCKVVIAVPWNRAGSFQNYVIYLKKGDVLQTRSATQVAVGLVGDFQYNLLPFLGLAR
ncbi:MAG: hypothetical protein IKX70_06765 [Treponema sp.]|nr:hypothetical protein [Treponema sp.]